MTDKSAGGRAVWANLTPEQRRAKIGKMQEARKRLYATETEEEALARRDRVREGMKRARRERAEAIASGCADPRAARLVLGTTPAAKARARMILASAREYEKRKGIHERRNTA